MTLRDDIYEIISSLRQREDGFIDGRDEATDAIMALVADYAEEVRSEMREQAAQDRYDDSLRF